MKKPAILIGTAALFLAGCAPHFHLDFLGKEKIEEVVLLESKAKEKILVLDITGLIGTAINPGLLEREGDILSRVHFRLKKAASDSLIKGVIIRLETPGGEANASDILYHEIRRFREKTRIPVLALMMGVAASGGYYVASACDLIYAHPGTITGSIGVISVFPSLEELLAKIGVKVNVIKSGALKDSGSALRDLTSEEKAVFQGITDEFYQKFLNAVLQGRRGLLSLDELKRIADGRVYTAGQAKEFKLVDDIGYFDTALEKALALARLSTARVVAYTYYPKFKTNLYASTLESRIPFENRALENIVHSLKSGFYYLWLPQAIF